MTKSILDTMPPETLGALYPMLKRQGPAIFDRGLGKYVLDAIKKHPEFQKNKHAVHMSDQIGKLMYDAMVKPIDEMRQSHAGMLDLLRTHAADETLAPLLNSYEALGAKLPDKDHLAHLKTTLSRHWHPDRGMKAGPIGDVNSHITVLDNDKARLAYETAQKKGKGLMNSLYEGLTGGKRDPVHAPIDGQKLLEGPHTNKVVNSLTKGHKVGIAFAAVTVVAAGAYYLNQRHKKKTEAQPEPQVAAVR